MKKLFSNFNDGVREKTELWRGKKGGQKRIAQGILRVEKKNSPETLSSRKKKRV